MSLTQPPDIWESGDPYERYVGRWSRQVAPTFLAWLGVPSGRRWLDIGCGTGALCAAIADHCAPSTLVGVEPSEGFLNTAREQLSGRAALKRGNAGIGAGVRHVTRPKWTVTIARSLANARSG